jgi:plastocyanin
LPLDLFCGKFYQILPSEIFILNSLIQLIFLYCDLQKKASMDLVMGFSILLSLVASSTMVVSIKPAALAQNADSLESEKVLIGDAIQDLQKNDTKSAAIHLDIAERQLSLFPSNLGSKEEIKLLIKDANEALGNNDTHTAILHLNIATKQISKPVEQLITNATQSSVQKVHPDLSTGPAIVNLTILNLAYHPNPVKVKKGDDIQVTNKDSVYQYTVTNDNRSNNEEPGKLFDTGVINPGQSAKFNTSKLVDGQKYSFHDKMKANVKGILEVVKLDTERSKTVAQHIQVSKPRETLDTTKMTEMKQPNLTNTTAPVKAQSDSVRFALDHLTHANTSSNTTSDSGSVDTSIEGVTKTIKAAETSLINHTTERSNNLKKEIDATNFTENGAVKGLISKMNIFAAEVGVYGGGTYKILHDTEDYLLNKIKSVGASAFDASDQASIAGWVEKTLQNRKEHPDVSNQIFKPGFNLNQGQGESTSTPLTPSPPSQEQQPSIIRTGCPDGYHRTSFGDCQPN